MIRTIILALALVPASLAAKPLPPEDTERLLAISVDLDRRGFEQEADDVYAAATQRAFYKDDHPELLRDDDDKGQPWFCEDYLANDETPFPGCVHEPRGKSK